MTVEPEGVVRFWFRGSVQELSGVRPTQSVLHWLRETGASLGTKEGCNAGDCGACTVVLAEHDRAGGVHLLTANSCLLLLPRLHGRALFTVEDVGDSGAMHPVQAAMVAAGGSQCGFCTPGFVMSLWHGLETRSPAAAPPTRDELAGMLTGNLCRCTGYRPILDAAAEAAGQLAASHPSAEREHDSSLVARARAALGALAAGDAAGDTLTLSAAAGSYLAPTSEADLIATLVAHPDARILAGGTDLVPAWRISGEELRDDVVLVSLDAVDTLRGIDDRPDAVVIGAATTLEDTWAALVERLPSLRRMHERFASPGIRAVGTIGGNIANASPVADLVPVLVALDAEVVVLGPEGARTLPVAEVATGVRRTSLRRGEVLARVAIPSTSFEWDVRAYKVSRRFDDDISAVSATLAVRLAGGVVEDVRAVFGGMATTVRRAAAVEAALRGRALGVATVEAAVAALPQDFSPIDDHRASAAYRQRVAAALMRRWANETATDAAAVPLDVWADA